MESFLDALFLVVKIDSNLFYQPKSLNIISKIISKKDFLKKHGVDLKMEELNFKDIEPAKERKKVDFVEKAKDELAKVRYFPFLNRSGRRLGANKVIVRQTKNGQFHITIPRAIANATRLKKGSIIQFEFQAYGGIKLSWKNPDDSCFKSN